METSHIIATSVPFCAILICLNVQIKADTVQLLTQWKTDTVFKLSPEFFIDSSEMFCFKHLRPSPAWPRGSVIVQNPTKVERLFFPSGFRFSSLGLILRKKYLGWVSALCITLDVIFYFPVRDSDNYLPLTIISILITGLHTNALLIVKTSLVLITFKAWKI